MRQLILQPYIINYLSSQIKNVMWVLQSAHETDDVRSVETNQTHITGSVISL
jgi:hypothetical protein